MYYADLDHVLNSPKASISLNDFKILEEQEWPDSNVPRLGYRGMNLLSCNEFETGPALIFYISFCIS